MGSLSRVVALFRRRRVSGETIYMASLWFPTRVLVVDDYEPWRRFFSTTLEKEPELQVIGQVSDGIEAACRIRDVFPTSKILFVSENRSLDIVEKALSTGAGGYVVKSDAGSELLPAVEAVLQGQRFVSASLWGARMRALPSRLGVRESSRLLDRRALNPTATN